MPGPADVENWLKIFTKQSPLMQGVQKRIDIYPVFVQSYKVFQISRNF